MSQSPMISVYMASKNRRSLLKRAMESVLSQDYPNFELVVVDDGSTDDTPELLQQYQQQHQNLRFIRNEQSVGVARARNMAIEAAQGEFISGLDDDDYFMPSRLKSLMAAYDERYAFICSSAIWDWGHKTKVADGTAKVFSLSEQLSYNHATSQVLVKRERMLAIGAFDTQLVARIDYDAWTCLMEKYGDAKRINQATYVVSRDDGIERITTSDRNIKGNLQFVEKHKGKMNRANLLNQAFWDMYARQSAFSLKQLCQQMTAGLMMIKLRYFIRINFLPNWHKQK